jgi:hypothetical protein
MGSAATLTHRDYTIGWICAIDTERVAAFALLEEEHTITRTVSDCGSSQRKTWHLSRSDSGHRPAPQLHVDSDWTDGSDWRWRTESKT